MHTVNGAVVGTLLLNGHLHYGGRGDALFSPASNSIASIVLLGLVGLALLPRRSKPPAFGGSRRPVADHG
jgi:hypothetical protein